MPLFKSGFLLAGLLTLSVAHAQVDKAIGGTTTLDTLASRYVAVIGNPGNVSVVSDPAGSGKQVLKFNASGTDSLVGGLNTNYISPLGETTAVGLRWYALSVYFPSDWNTSVSNPVTVAKIDTASASGLPAVLSIVARADNLELSLVGNYLKSGAASVANSSIETTRLAKITRGKWYCLVLRAEWYQNLGAGSLSLWLNADKLYDSQRALNNYGTAFGNVPRVGLMFGGAMGLAGRSIYTDFIRLGGATSYVEQMYAETPCAASAAATFSAAKIATAK